MRKILVAFDGSVYAEGALEYAFYLGNKEEDLITGVFIEDLSYLNYINVFGEEYLPMDLEVMEEIKHESKSKEEENINKFEARCQKAGWNYDVHYDKGVPAYELIKESLFADLIVMGYQTFFSNVENISDQDLLKDLLPEAECPVIAVSENQQKLDNIVLTYDGKESSVFAIKQFKYLFPKLSRQKNMKALTVSESQEKAINYENLIEEYLSFHFPEADLEKLTGRPEEQIIQFAQSYSNPLVVMGAYGRNIFSRFFSKSIAEKIIKEQTVPIFVTHK